MRDATPRSRYGHTRILPRAALLVLVVLLSSSVPPGSQPVYAEVILGSAINVTTTPNQIAANKTTNRIYVTQPVAGTVTVLDGITNQVIGTITFPGGSQPVGVAVDHTTNRIYVTCFGDDKVRVIDGGSGADNDPGALVAGEITVGDQPFSVAVDPTTHRAYVANRNAGSVSVIQGSTNGSGGPGAVVGSAFNFGAAAATWAVAVNTTTHRVYVVNAGETFESVTVIQGATSSDDPLPGVPVGTAIPVGDGPSAVAVNSTTNRIYVTNFEGDNVSVIDGAGGGNGGAGDVVSTVTVGGQPSGVAVNPNGNRVYVTNESPDTVSIIDGRTNTTDGSAITVGTDPTGIAVNPTTGFVYVANNGTTTVSVLERPFLQEAVIGLPIPFGNGPTRVAVNSITNRVYVVNSIVGSASTVSVIDGGASGNGGAGTIVGSAITVGLNSSGVAVNPITNRVYVTNLSSNNVSVIDGRPTLANPAGAIVGSAITVGTLPDIVAIDPTTNRVYVKNSFDDTISVIDGSASGNGGAGTVIGSITIGNGLTGMAVNPTTHRVYVSNVFDDTVRVIQGSVDGTGGPGTFVGDPIAFEFNHNPAGVAVNPTTNRVYVSSQAKGTVSAIDGGAGEIVGTAITVGAGPIDGAVNPTTGRVYVGNQFSNTISVLDGGATQSNLAGAVVGSAIPFGSGLIDGAINPTTGRVYVGNQFSNTISVLDGGATQSNLAGAVVGSAIPFGSGLIDGAINPTTGRVYVTNQFSNAVSAIGPTYSANLTGAPSGSVSNVLVTWDKLFGTSPGDSIGLFTAGATGPAATPFVSRFTNNSTSITGVGHGSGTVTLPIPANQAPNNYEIRLTSGHTNETLASVPYAVYGPPTTGAAPGGLAVNSVGTMSVPAENGALKNATDPDTHKTLLKAELLSTTPNGTLVLQPDGSFTYSPKGNFSGVDSFTYRVRDPQNLTSAPQTVNITVNLVNCGPQPTVKVTTAVANGVLTATVTSTIANAPNNKLNSLTFTQLDNAKVVVNNQTITTGQTLPITVPINAVSTTFTVDRNSAVLPPSPTTVRFKANDTCGSWPSFVGGGASAGF